MDLHVVTGHCHNKLWDISFYFLILKSSSQRWNNQVWIKLVPICLNLLTTIVWESHYCLMWWQLSKHNIYCHAQDLMDHYNMINVEGKKGHAWFHFKVLFRKVGDKHVGILAQFFIFFTLSVLIGNPSLFPCWIPDYLCLPSSIQQTLICYVHFLPSPSAWCVPSCESCLLTLATLPSLSWPSHYYC